MTDENRLAAEQRARVLIDRQLTDAGWVVQDRKDLNLFAQMEIIDSMQLALRSVRARVGDTPRRSTVKVSLKPSCRLLAVPGWVCSNSHCQRFKLGLRDDRGRRVVGGPRLLGHRRSEVIGQLVGDIRGLSGPVWPVKLAWYRPEAGRRALPKRLPASGHISFERPGEFVWLNGARGHAVVQGGYRDAHVSLNRQIVCGRIRKSGAGSTGPKLQLSFKYESG